jgi:hypothetical protein
MEKRRVLFRREAIKAPPNFTLDKTKILNSEEGGIPESSHRVDADNGAFGEAIEAGQNT